MEFKFNEKISIQDFAKLINNEWQELLKKDSEVHINIIHLEWITGEAITYLFSLIINLKATGFKIKVTLPNPGNLIDAKNEEKNQRNRFKRLASLIDVWKIESVCNLEFGREIIAPSNHNTLIEKTRQKYKYVDTSWYKILPFQKVKTPIFENINNIREHLDDKLNEIYSLEEDTLEILNRFDANKPFENQTLSHLLTTELFLNTIFHSGANECYFSIVLNSKFDESIEKEKFINQGFSEEEASKKAKNKVEWLKENILPKSIVEERDKETSNFFKRNGNYLNRSYLEFNYIDFGDGIPTTLEIEYNRFTSYLSELKTKSPSKYEEEVGKLYLFKSKNNNVTKDSKIIEYAFLLDSSKEPFDEALEIKDYMPRGLFFLIEVIRRFEGLILIRSKKGKIVYDFSDSRENNRAIKSGKMDFNFPGTMITIFLPNESKEGSTIEITEGAVELESFKVKKGTGKIRNSHLSIGQILSDAFKRVDYKTEKTKLNYALYTELFKGLNKRLKSENEDKEKRIVYIDFAGINLSFIESKIFFYLVNTPYINENHTNVVITNISNRYFERLKEIQELIRSTKPFHFRPIPCIIHTKDKGVEILWLGVSNKSDENKLSELLLSPPEVDFISISLMKNPDLIHGNFFRINWINRKDNSGNVFLNYFPDLNEIKYESCFRISNRLSKNIKKYELVWLNNKETAYLTSGGKYQYQFLNFIELLATFRSDGTTFYSKQIARYLVNKWLFDNTELPDQIDWIVSVTLSGQILAREVLNELKIFFKDSDNTPELIRLAHYYEFENEEYGLNSISEGDTSIIVTDVISTGDLLKRLTKSIESRGGKVSRYLSIADVRDLEKYSESKIDYKLTSLMLPSDFINDKDFDFKKYDSIQDFHKEVIRINPIINAPVSIKLSERNKTNNNVLFDFQDFIDKYITEDYLLIGYFKNNNTFHSYFFDTNNYFKSKIGKYFFSELIKKCAATKTNKKHDVVAFPIFSGIENVDEFYLKEILLDYGLIGTESIIIPLPRVDTPNGWRFSFPPESLNEKVSGNILLIDDGSLSGETIIQMIDSICFFSVLSITLISVFGRLRDFQKEFFSQIKGLINVKHGIDVYFGIHAHIPYYPFNKSFPLHQEFNELSNIDLKEIRIEEEKQYISKRLNDINAKVLYSKKTNKTENLRCLPKNSKNEIDRKKIYILRDAIGKLEHYRLYKEYYSDFSIENEEDYELLLAIVLHEPSLISVVKNLLPEVYRKLRSLLDLNSIENKDALFKYKWEIESLIRLMFMFNKELFWGEDLIVSLANLTLNDEYLQGYLIHEYNKILNENDTKSIVLKYKLYSASIILAKKGVFDESFIKPLLRNFENIKNNNVTNAFSKLIDSVYKEKILPGHSKFVDVKSPLITNLKNITKDIDRNKLENLSDLIQEELLDPLKMIMKCDEFFPTKNEIFKTKKSPIFIIEQLIENIDTIENKAHKERSQLADDIKNFVDNFAADNSSLRLFLSKYPTDVKKSIVQISEEEKYNTSLINFNLNELGNCETVLPMHSFYFELIIKEIFDNIIQEYADYDVNISYRFDKNFIAVKQNKPFNDGKKKLGGLFYIQNIVELFGGLCEQIKHSNSYEINFIFK
jgi:adenine/guanine phosphoribosyltransferase-like PRPP-binding protein